MEIDTLKKTSAQKEVVKHLCMPSQMRFLPCWSLQFTLALAQTRFALASRCAVAHKATSKAHLDGTNADLTAHLIVVKLDF